MKVRVKQLRIALSQLRKRKNEEEKRNCVEGSVSSQHFKGGKELYQLRSYPGNARSSVRHRYV
jgi:hypothetical protein